MGQTVNTTWILFQSATKINTKSKTVEVKLGLYTRSGLVQPPVHRDLHVLLLRVPHSPQSWWTQEREEWSVANGLQTSGWGTHRHKGGTEGGPVWT